MIVVRVELHSAITREVTELARMEIANDGPGVGSRPEEGRLHGPHAQGAVPGSA
jgi:hypothetical protein